MRSEQQIRDDFIEQMGERCQAEGLTRIAGRIFGILLFDGKRYAFGELAQTLEVSRASISTSAQSLIELGLITRIREASERKDYFELADQPYVALMQQTLRKANDTLDMLELTLAELPSSLEGTRARLGEFAQFYTELKVMSASLIERLDGAPK